MNYVLLVLSVGLAVIGQLFMKKGMLQIGEFSLGVLAHKLFPMISNPFVFTGFVLFGISSVFWLVVLSRINLSVAYPMVSLGYIVVAFASIFLFKENVSLVRWLGIIIICIGVVFVSRS